MESFTGITPLDVWLKQNTREVKRVKPFDLHELKTGLLSGKKNSLINESAAADQILIVHSYEIISARDLNLDIRANNEDIISTTELAHEFGEGIVIWPHKSIEINESHTTSTIPIKVIVKISQYDLV